MKKFFSMCSGLTGLCIIYDALRSPNITTFGVAFLVGAMLFASAMRIMGIEKE